MKLICLVLLSWFFSPAVTAPAHEFHLSRTVIRYIEHRQEVQVEMHIFLDDLEKGLAVAGAEELNLGTELEAASAARYLEAYLDKNFKIYWDGAELPRELLGYEITDDLEALWIYFLASADKPPSKLKVLQSSLTEIYDDQRNLVQVDLGEAGKANYLLSTGKTSEEQVF